jgi:DNA-binding transcriptional MerR regulator/quercetin dioxygenase-like cupin family protein
VSPSDGKTVIEANQDVSVADRPALYIRQAAELVGVSTAALRDWERQGLIQPQRTASGYRLYALNDIQRLRRIRDLKNDRVNAAGVRQVLQLGGDPVGDDERARAPLGAQIRRLRRERNISLRELAARTGLSPSYLSAVERTKSRPSVASLQKLAAALGTNLSQMFGDSPAEPADSPVVRPHERRHLYLDTPGVVFEMLTVREQELEPTLTRIAPGCGSEGSYNHDGEEFIFVLDGMFEITLDETQAHLLHPGDAITFRSHIPHRWRNPGTIETILIWVNTPPTF